METYYDPYVFTNLLILLDGLPIDYHYFILFVKFLLYGYTVQQDNGYTI